MADEIHFGQIAWNDLTVPDAAPVHEFYEAVVDWKSLPVAMDGYSDYSMTVFAAKAQTEFHVRRTFRRWPGFAAD